jgi:hypothetical protein
MEVVSFMFQWKSIWHLLSWRLGGFQNWSGHFGGQRNPLPLPGMEPWILNCPLHSLVTTPTALSESLWKLSNANKVKAMCHRTEHSSASGQGHKETCHPCHLHTEKQMRFLMGALNPTQCQRVCFSLLMTELQNWSICVLVAVTGDTT